MPINNLRISTKKVIDLRFFKLRFIARLNLSASLLPGTPSATAPGVTPTTPSTPRT